MLEDTRRGVAERDAGGAAYSLGGQHRALLVERVEALRELVEVGRQKVRAVVVEDGWHHLRILAELDDQRALGVFGDL